MAHLTFLLEPREPEFEPELLQQVGRIVTYWGRIDHTLDGDIRAMYRSPVCRHFKRPVPNAFSSRLKLWSELSYRIWPEG
jgi:hypothetical protein